MDSLNPPSSPVPSTIIQQETSRPTSGASLIGPENVDTPQPTNDQPATKLRGGFEVDDEGDVADPDGQDTADDDVYNDTIQVHVNGSAVNGDQNVVDRSPQTPTQENGITPTPAQATDSPANLLSSASNNPQPSTIISNGPSSADPSSSTAADSLSAAPKSRLAHDVVGILEDRIKDDPRGDTAAWLELIEEYKRRNKDDQVRQTYERYLETFPLAVCTGLR